MAISNIRGSIRVSSRGVTAAELATKLTNSIATDRLWGRDTAGTGGSEALTVGGGLGFTGSGGIEIAASGVATAKIAAGAVTGAKIAADTIATGNISDNAIVAAKIASNVVTTDKINDLAVTEGKIAANVVTTGKIADGAVVALKIATSAVETAKIQDSAVTAAKIAADAVTAAKIAINSVTTTKILDATITEAKLANNIITTGKINDSAVTEGKIAANVVTTGKIADGAVVAAKLATSAVETAKLQDGSVSAIKIATDAVTSAKIAAGAVVAAKIATNAVVEVNIAAGAVTQSKIGSAAVVTAALADDNVTTVKLANDAVTQAKIADSAVGTAQLITGTITAAKIADLNITTTKLADLSVTAGKIVDLNVTTAKIANDAVTAAKIPDGSIITAKIADGHITTVKIDTDAITSAKIADGHVLTAHLATDAVIGSKIADDAVTAAKIADNQITSSHIIDANVTATKLASNAVTPAHISAAMGSASEVAPTESARFIGRTSGVVQVHTFSALRDLLRVSNFDLIYQAKSSVLGATTASFTEELEDRIGDITDIEGKVLEALTTPDGFPGRTAGVGGSSGTVARYTAVATGAAHLVAPLALSATIRTLAADRGRELRLTGAKDVYTTTRQPVYPGEAWEFTWRFIRRTDPTDPSGDAVQPIIVCLNYQHAEVARFEFDEPPHDDIKIVDGLQTFTKIISSSAGSGIDAVWPASTVHIVAGFKTFGTDGQTSLQVMALRNLTDLTAWSPSTTSFDARLVALEATDLTGVDGRLDVIESRFGAIDLYDSYYADPAADLTHEAGTPYEYTDPGATALIHAGDLLIVRAGDGEVVDQYPGIRPNLWVRDNARFSNNLGLASGGGYGKTHIGGGILLCEVGDTGDLGTYCGVTEGQVHGAELTPIIPVGGRGVFGHYGGFVRGGNSAAGYESGPLTFGPPEFNISYIALNWGGRIRYDMLPEVPHSTSPNDPGIRRAVFEIRGTPEFDNTVGCETALRLWWTSLESGDTIVETQRIVRVKKLADISATDLVMYVRGTTT